MEEGSLSMPRVAVGSDKWSSHRVDIAGINSALNLGGTRPLFVVARTVYGASERESLDQC